MIYIATNGILILGSKIKSGKMTKTLVGKLYGKFVAGVFLDKVEVSGLKKYRVHKRFAFPVKNFYAHC